MSQATALLNSLLENDYSTIASPINDILVVDAESRTINVPASEVLFGTVTDGNVERKYFQCPRIVGDNIDLSTLSLRIHYKNANRETDKYIVDDVTVDEDAGIITFSWLLGPNLLNYSGDVYFALCAVKTDDEGYETNKWNTTLAMGKVLDGLEVEDLDYDEEERVRDVLQQLLDMINSGTGSSGSGVSSWNDLTDKPFDYQCTTEVETILEETLVHFEQLHFDFADAYYGPIAPVIGDTYIVTYDGTPYECVARRSEDEDEGGIVHIGNGRAAWYELGEEVPFLITINEWDGTYTWMIRPSDTLMISDFLLKIEHVVKHETIKQLDEVYVPDSVKCDGIVDIVLTIWGEYFNGIMVGDRKFNMGWINETEGDESISVNISQNALDVAFDIMESKPFRFVCKNFSEDGSDVTYGFSSQVSFNRNNNSIHVYKLYAGRDVLLSFE